VSPTFLKALTGWKIFQGVTYAHSTGVAQFFLAKQKRRKKQKKTKKTKKTKKSKKKEPIIALMKRRRIDNTNDRDPCRGRCMTIKRSGFAPRSPADTCCCCCVCHHHLRRWSLAHSRSLASERASERACTNEQATIVVAPSELAGERASRDTHWHDDELTIALFCRNTWLFAFINP